MLNGKLVKPLSELSVYEVGAVLEALKLGKYMETLLNNEIDGRCLMKCNTVEDVVSMGIPITVKASLLLDEIRKWKTTGVPIEYLSVNQAASQDDDRNAEIKSPIVSYDTAYYYTYNCPLYYFIIIDVLLYIDRIVS